MAVGLGALLVGLLAAAGVAVGLTALSEADATGNATEIGLGGAIALLLALAVAYFAAAMSPAACRASTAPARVSPRGRSAWS